MKKLKEVKKLQTLIEKYRAIQAIGSSIEVPWKVQRLFPSNLQIDVIGTQIGFGEDYVSVDQARDALEWLVAQLGGTVKWD